MENGAGRFTLFTIQVEDENCVMILLLDNFIERNFVIDVILFYIVYTDIEKYYDKRKLK